MFGWSEKRNRGVQLIFEARAVGIHRLRGALWESKVNDQRRFALDLFAAEAALHLHVLEVQRPRSPAALPPTRSFRLQQISGGDDDGYNVLLGIAALQPEFRRQPKRDEKTKQESYWKRHKSSVLDTLIVLSVRPWERKRIR